MAFGNMKGKSICSIILLSTYRTYRFSDGSSGSSWWCGQVVSQKKCVLNPRRDIEIHEWFETRKRRKTGLVQFRQTKQDPYDEIRLNTMVDLSSLQMAWWWWMILQDIFETCLDLQFSQEKIVGWARRRVVAISVGVSCRENVYIVRAVGWHRGRLWLFQFSGIPYRGLVVAVLYREECDSRIGRRRITSSNVKLL